MYNINNLLQQAMSIIGSNIIYIVKQGDVEIDEQGLLNGAYEDKIETTAIVEALDMSITNELGLSTHRPHIRVFCNAEVDIPGPTIGGDLIEYQGVRYTPIQKTDWILWNGWVELICVQEGGIK